MSGSIAIGGTHIAKIVFRLLSSVILTRLLYPEAFGYMAIVLSAVVIIGLSTDIGIKPFLIRYPGTLSNSMLNVLWTMKVMRSVFLFAAMQALSWPLADFYGDEKVGNLLRIVSFSSLVSALSPLSLHWAEKEKRFRFVAGAEFAAFSAQTVTVLIATAIFKSYWCLALGAVVNSFVMFMIASHISGYKYPRFSLNWEHVKEIWRFVKWIAMGSVIFVAVMQADRFVLGKIFGAEILGIYAIALTIAEAASNMAQNIGHRVGFPTWADARRQGKISQSFGNFSKVYLPVAGMVSGALVMMADDVIAILYDERYAMAGAVLTILALRTVLISLLTISVDVLIVDGKPKAMFTANMIRLLWVVGMLLLVIGSEEVLIYAFIFAAMDVPPILFYTLTAKGFRRLFLLNIIYAVVGFGVGALLGSLGTQLLPIMFPWL